MPTVPWPLSNIASSGTEPSLNNHDLRFGFHLPPLADRPRSYVQDVHVPPLMAGISTPPSNTSVTMIVSPIASVAETGGSEVPIDPVLLTESQATGINARTSGTIASNNSRSEDDSDSISKGDRDESEDEYEPDGANSSENELEQQVRSGFPINA
jgi:hypothetical protein